MDAGADQLKQAIESQYGGNAVLVRALPVTEYFDGKSVWTGSVHVFGLVGHHRATQAYAWSAPIEGSTTRRSYAVLRLGNITSPVDALRAALGSNHQARMAGA